MPCIRIHLLLQPALKFLRWRLQETKQILFFSKLNSNCLGWCLMLMLRLY